MWKMPRRLKRKLKMPDLLSLSNECGRVCHFSYEFILHCIFALKSRQQFPCKLQCSPALRNRQHFLYIPCPCAAHFAGSYLTQLSGIKLSGKALNWYIILMAAFPFAICHLPPVTLHRYVCVHTRHSTTTLHWIAVCGTHFITFRARLSELRWLSNSNWRYLSTPHNANFPPPPTPPDFRWLKQIAAIARRRERWVGVGNILLTFGLGSSPLCSEAM